VAAVTRRLLVAPTPSSALPGDAAMEFDLDGPDRPQIEPAETGKVTVRPKRAEGSPAAPIVHAVFAPLRRSAGGATIIEVVVDGWRFELVAEDAARAQLRRRATRVPDATAASGPTEIRAIIPGRIAAIHVVAGDVVEAGQSLLVVEAMKMQNELRTSHAGTVERVAVGEGESIDNGDLLVILR
jgi:biotin carboxyl carrier protein